MLLKIFFASQREIVQFLGAWLTFLSFFVIFYFLLLSSCLYTRFIILYSTYHMLIYLEFVNNSLIVLFLFLFRSLRRLFYSFFYIHYKFLKQRQQSKMNLFHIDILLYNPDYNLYSLSQITLLNHYNHMMVAHQNIWLVQLHLTSIMPLSTISSPPYFIHLEP